MFENLKKAVEAEAARKIENSRFFIENGFFPTWAEEHRNDPDRGLRQYSTPAKWDAYKAGKLSREKAVEKAEGRAVREVSKWLEGELEKLRTAEAAPDLEQFSISVEWKRNCTWGNNPSALVAVPGCGIYDGHASGCGYDKQSAAVAEALNQSASVRKALYAAAEKALESGKTYNEYENGNVSWRYILGYGSGYSILPYFEGGVGVSCFWSMFESMGYSVRGIASGRMFDAWSVEKVTA